MYDVMTEQEKLVAKEKVIEYLRQLPVYKWAAKSIGKDADTLRNWRDEDEEFSARCESARAEAVTRFGKRASPDFMLAAIDGETFGKKDKLEVSGELTMYKKLSDEQLNDVINSKLRKLGIVRDVAGEGTADQEKPAEVRDTTSETT